MSDDVEVPDRETLAEGEAAAPARARRRGARIGTKLLVTAGSLLVIAALVALILPVLVPFLPAPAQRVLGGTITTVPGTVEELLAGADIGDGRKAGDLKLSHADVDDEYVFAASIWPWQLPQDWAFPRYRGAPDTPGQHWNGMGIAAAYSKYATAVLDTVRTGELSDAEANAMLDELEGATRILLTERVLSDRSFIDRQISPLRR